MMLSGILQISSTVNVGTYGIFSLLLMSSEINYLVDILKLTYDVFTVCLLQVNFLCNQILDYFSFLKY